MGPSLRPRMLGCRPLELVVVGQRVEPLVHGLDFVDERLDFLRLLRELPALEPRPGDGRPLNVVDFD